MMPTWETVGIRLWTVGVVHVASPWRMSLAHGSFHAGWCSASNPCASHGEREAEECSTEAAWFAETEMPQWIRWNGCDGTLGGVRRRVD